MSNVHPAMSEKTINRYAYLPVKQRAGPNLPADKQSQQPTEESQQSRLILN